MLDAANLVNNGQNNQKNANQTSTISSTKFDLGSNNISSAPPLRRSQSASMPSPISVSPATTTSYDQSNDRRSSDMGPTKYLTINSGSARTPLNSARSQSTSDNEVDTTESSIDLPRLPSNVPSGSHAHQTALVRRHIDYGGETLEEARQSLMELKEFLLTAPMRFSKGDIICQFRLPNDEQISCVHWANTFCITGTDIVRSLVRRFVIFGREVLNRKKFEEGIFSDLRNLKVNIDSTLEGSKSELLEILYKRHCVRTKKKQKVFYWNSVHHERLFIDALSRELRREISVGGRNHQNANMASTVAVREPALSFKYDTSIPLIDQIPSILSTMEPEHAAIFKELTTASDRTQRDSSRDARVENLRSIVTGAPGSVPMHSIDQRYIPSYEYNNAHRVQQQYQQHQQLSIGDNVGSVSMMHDSAGGQMNSMISPRSKNYPITPQLSIQKHAYASAVGEQDNGHLNNGAARNSSPLHLSPESIPPQTYKSNLSFRDNVNDGPQNSSASHFSKAPAMSYQHQLLQSPLQPPFGQSRNDKLISLRPVSSSTSQLIESKTQAHEKLQDQNGNNLPGGVHYATGIDIDSFGDDPDTDFPLEVLARGDREQSVSSSSASRLSFDNQYSDFVHQHRPALSFSSQYDISEYDDDQRVVPSISQSFNVSTSESKVASYGPSSQYGHTHVSKPALGVYEHPASPDWDQYLERQHDPTTVREIPNDFPVAGIYQSTPTLSHLPLPPPVFTTPSSHNSLRDYKQPRYHIFGRSNGIHKAQAVHSQLRQPRASFYIPHEVAAFDSSVSQGGPSIDPDSLRIGQDKYCKS